jgi:hypothetical protein
MRLMMPASCGHSMNAGMTVSAMTTSRKKSEEIETRPDGWQRFEMAVDAAVKSGPKHRPSKAHVELEEGKTRRAVLAKATVKKPTR